jgi:hypothetical protein
MRPTRAARAVSLAALLMGVALTGCYNPNPPSGSLICSAAGACPEGYLCAASDNTCRKPKVINPAAARFEGHWIFAASSKITTLCSDSTTPSTVDIAADYVDVTAGDLGDLVGSYFCDWDLNVTSSGTSTTIPAGQSCPGTSADSKTNFVYTGKTFAFTTADGSTGALNATISAAYTDVVGCTANCTGTCNIAVVGTLDKSPL